MAAPMEVSLPQKMLQKLLDLLKLESLKFCLKIHVHVIRHIRCQVDIDYHNQHESAALIGLCHATSLVLPSVVRLPELSETDAERSTGVPLLSAAESTYVYPGMKTRINFIEAKIHFTAHIVFTND